MPVQTRSMRKLLCEDTIYNPYYTLRSAIKTVNMKPMNNQEYTLQEHKELEQYVLRKCRELNYFDYTKPEYCEMLRMYFEFMYLMEDCLPRLIFSANSLNCANKDSIYRLCNAIRHKTINVINHILTYVPYIDIVIGQSDFIKHFRLQGIVLINSIDAAFHQIRK